MATPKQKSLEKSSVDLEATLKILQTRARTSSRSSVIPKAPISSAWAARTKSVCDSGSGPIFASRARSPCQKPRHAGTRAGIAQSGTPCSRHRSGDRGGKEPALHVLMAEDQDQAEGNGGQDHRTRVPEAPPMRKRTSPRARMKSAVEDPVQDRPALS